MYTPRAAGFTEAGLRHGQGAADAMEQVDYVAFCDLLTSRKPLDRLFCPGTELLAVRDRESGRIYTIEESSFFDCLSHDAAAGDRSSSGKRPR